MNWESALTVVGVFGADCDDASPGKASLPSAGDDPAVAVDAEKSKNQRTDVANSKNQGTVAEHPKTSGP